jgi:hypothetical protein
LLESELFVFTKYDLSLPKRNKGLHRATQDTTAAC